MTLFAYCTYLVIPVNVSGHMFLLVVYMFLCICEFVCISECTCVSLYVYLRLYTYIYLRLYTHVDKFSYIFIKTILIFKRKRIRKHTNPGITRTSPAHVDHIQSSSNIFYIRCHTTRTSLHQVSPDQPLQHLRGFIGPAGATSLHDRNTASNDSIAFSPLS